MNRFDEQQENERLVNLEQLKRKADEAATRFRGNPSYRNVTTRIQECANNVHIPHKSGSAIFNYTWYCKHRHCPICQDRYSARWAFGMRWILQSMRAEGDKPHWLFLTLTVRNCPVTELRSQIKAMNKAFSRMTNRKLWRHVRGSIRFLEVDQGQDDPETAHPHFHCLLLVTPSMHGGKDYLSQERWAQLWKECLQVHYTPEVDVQRLTPDGQKADVNVPVRVSYSTKPRLNLPEASWFLEMVEQVQYTRRANATGELRNWIKYYNELNPRRHLDGVDPEPGSNKLYRWDPDQGFYVEV